MSDDFEATALEYQDRLAMMTDREVRDAYLATDGEPGGSWADALALECQRRNIDI